MFDLSVPCRMGGGAFMVCKCSSFSLSCSVPEKSALDHITVDIMIARLLGSMSFFLSSQGTLFKFVGTLASYEPFSQSWGVGKIKKNPKSLSYFLSRA